ncbi:15-hydroxyprostaglandin dehydrogenase [NAD(+)] [Sphaeramia orbicularis]|uniref:15-hydroxyprostaglandin dehydrogenase [NAD(+)] n=1 Tax=Sphaeramia orbicularis TaxID=375764 RepID=A0A672YW60_9TELE|nr:15-hydroxyprostaglandin dehydrogenase [NAD(+)]-like [Sphaeramia orbicularis]
MALVGKIAAVTGAGKGIGQALTETLLKNGAKVALLDVNEAAGKSLAEALGKQYGQDKVLFINCNVESDEQMKAAFQKIIETFEAIDIFCNNAGILNETQWEKTISINLMGVIRGAYLALEHMNKLTGGRGGVILNTASMAGLGPLLSCPAYTASKHGVVGFTRAMGAASAASGYGVRFNALCPGFVQTDLFNNIQGNLGQFSHLRDAAQLLIDKMGTMTASEVVECVIELLTDETKNGEVFYVYPQGTSYVTFPSMVK